MRAVFAFVAFVGLVGAISYRDVLEAEWGTFKAEYDKVYESEDEELLRKFIFFDNKKMIDKHNNRYAADEVTYEMGVNQFTDMLPKEFEDTMLRSLNMTDATADIDIIYNAPENIDVPDNIDWRSKGAVTRVKSQGSCGSCWAFSAVATLEGQHFVKTRQLLELSEQNMLDCSSRAPYNNKGCNGGNTVSGLRYVKDNGGIDVESSYPYTARQLQCRFDRNKVGATVRDIVMLKQNDESLLAAAVAVKGPISVAIFVGDKFMHYRSGVFNDASCKKTPNHAVLVVGYGHDSRGGDYWLVKNSWGRNWGEGGYVRMARNKNNQCAIASYAIFPLV